MIKFYFNLSPNPTKVALLLEELGVPYDPIPVDPRKGEQFTPEYLAINPNAKVPAIVDDGTTVFDSNAILLYLAEKTGRFLPSKDAQRGELLSWLMFVATGIGPYSGQAVHFHHFAPQPQEYGINRYDFEVERHYKIVDERLGKQPYMLGDEYTIVDMALWGWARLIPRALAADDALDKFPNVKRLHDQINARPAATQGVERLRELYKFKEEWDEDARRWMFPQLVRLGLK
ncbi:MAG: glutathione S-transferase N-terminal domain-containing protein [Burkholderiales bacterium]|jgi:GST-like protein